MTGTDLCVNKCKQFRSYLNHLVFRVVFTVQDQNGIAAEYSCLLIK